MKPKDLTPNELWVLIAIYKQGEAEAHDILELASQHGKNWKNNNVDSFLTQLYVMGYVTRERESRRYRYKPKLSLTEVVCQVLDKMFIGLFRDQPVPLLNYLVQTKKLSKREIEILEFIIILVNPTKKKTIPKKKTIISNLLILID